MLFPKVKETISRSTKQTPDTSSSKSAVEEDLNERGKWVSKIIYLYALLLPQANFFFIRYSTEKGLEKIERWNIGKANGKKSTTQEKACGKAGHWRTKPKSKSKVKLVHQR